MILNSSILRKFTRADRRLYARVMNMSFDLRRYVNTMTKSERKKFPSWECHSICRTIARHIRKLRVVDGYYIGLELRINKNGTSVYLRRCTHSWLITQSGAIIDAYPVGIFGNPILVVARGRYKNFGRNLY